MFYDQSEPHPKYKMQYPKKWEALETDFEKQYFVKPHRFKLQSLQHLCLSDYLIFQRWIDYAKGIGDPISDKFSKIPVKYPDTFEIAKGRRE